MRFSIANLLALTTATALLTLLCSTGEMGWSLIPVFVLPLLLALLARLHWSDCPRFLKVRYHLGCVLLVLPILVIGLNDGIGWWRLVSIEVLVPEKDKRRTQMEIVERAIRNLELRFDENISKLLRWYGQSFPEGKPKSFERELLKSSTFFLDFTVSPAKREWIFWETHLQHFGVPVSTRGSVASMSP